MPVKSFCVNVNISQDLCVLFLFISLLFLLFKVYLWNIALVFNIVYTGHQVLGSKLEFAQYEAFKQLGPHLHLIAALDGGYDTRPRNLPSVGHQVLVFKCKSI